MTTPLQLANEHVLAQFDDRGYLCHLSAPKGDNLIAQSFHQYWDKTANQMVKPEQFELVRMKAHDEQVTTTHRSPHLEVTVAYRLPRKAVLLQLQITVRGTGQAASIIVPTTPALKLAPDFNDIIEDPRDLYCDGIEIGHGREIPAWRVLYRKGYQRGLLLATRSKLDMAHFNFLADTIDWRAHSTENYSTQTERPVLDSSRRRTYRGAYEIGPWSARQHEPLLRAAKLHTPVSVKHARATGRPPRRLVGHVFHAATIAGSAASRSYKPDRWIATAMPWSVSGTGLLAPAGAAAKPVRFKSKLRGPHRVIAGIGDGYGLTLRISGQPHTNYRVGISSMLIGLTAFNLALSGRHQPGEVDFGVIDLQGQTLEFGRFPDLHGYCILDYIRLVPLSGAELDRWKTQEIAQPVLPLCGLNDTPDIAIFTDGRDPDPKAYADNLWAHAQARVNKVYWRIDGQCSDYPSKLNTMRYISAKVHGVYSPQAKAYGRVLRKVDMLKLAVKAARANDLQLYGWMRFNSYMGNVASDFYKQHPEFWEEWDNGRRGGKLCLAFPEVRQHKIGILVEAASYGLTGLCLGFLRHPPVLQYAPLLCESYQKKYGNPPPRDPKHPDAHHRYSWPRRGEQQAEYERWWQHRADYLTQFGRELRQALRDAGLGHVKIAMTVRPNHCLFDGIDLPRWLSEKLCDEVVTEHYLQSPQEPELGWETAAFKQMVRGAGVPLIRTLTPSISEARRDLARILGSGDYDGICSYESDFTVLQSDFLDLFRSIRGVKPASA